jgi:hypothetical protein
LLETGFERVVSAPPNSTIFKICAKIAHYTERPPRRKSKNGRAGYIPAQPFLCICVCARSMRGKAFAYDAYSEIASTGQVPTHEPQLTHVASLT